jgi:large subunit ribosomal protein L1
MPNPKLGTVTMNVKEAVAAAKRGQAEYKCEKRGIVMAGIGKASFPAQHLRENLRALMLSIGDAKPEGLKGAFVRSVYIRSTMGPAIPVDLLTVDPSSSRFMEVPMAIPTAAATTGAAAGVVVPPPSATAAAAAAPLA